MVHVTWNHNKVICVMKKKKSSFYKASVVAVWFQVDWRILEQPLHQKDSSGTAVRRKLQPFGILVYPTSLTSLYLLKQQMNMGLNEAHSPTFSFMVGIKNGHSEHLVFMAISLLKCFFYRKKKPLSTKLHWYCTDSNLLM